MARVVAGHGTTGSCARDAACASSPTNAPLWCVRVRVRVSEGRRGSEMRVGSAGFAGRV